MICSITKKSVPLLPQSIVAPMRAGIKPLARRPWRMLYCRHRIVPGKRKREDAAVRSVKDIIIGFLLILIGFALSAYSLPVSIAVAVGGPCSRSCCRIS